MRTLESRIGITLALAALAWVRQAHAAPPAPEENPTSAAAFAKLEARLPGLDASKRRLLLRELATAAFDAGETTKASRFATELVSPSSATHEGANGNEIHIGHIVLGRLALRAGDVAGAKQHLLESGHTPGSPQLQTFGPNMSLAKELLGRGERKAVVDYFVACAKFWRSGRERGVLTEWAGAVQKGEVPDFGANLHYLWYNPKYGSVLDAREPPGGRELTEGEKRAIADAEVRAKEAARKDLLAIYAELKGPPAGNPTSDELERAIVEAIPADELTRALRDTRRPEPDAPATTPARRYAAVRRGISREVVAELTRRVPHERMSAVLAAYVRSDRRPSETRGGQ
jgi:hypothetical protein